MSSSGACTFTNGLAAHTKERELTTKIEETQRGTTSSQRAAVVLVETSVKQRSLDIHVECHSISSTHERKNSQLRLRRSSEVQQAHKELL